MNNCGKLFWITLTLIARQKILSDASEIFLQRNSQETLPCQTKNAFKRCSWIKDSFQIDSEKEPLPGYSIERNENNTECNLTIWEVRANDSGTWLCNTTGGAHNILNATVGVLPDNYFVYGTNVIPRGRRKFKVIPDPETGEAIIHCVSSHAHPAPSLTLWTSDRLDKNETERSVIHHDGSATVTKTIVLRFLPVLTRMEIRSQMEITVECFIWHMGYDTATSLRTTFAREYPPADVQLLLHGSDITEHKLLCSASGFPEPRIEILRIDPETKTPIGQAVEATQLMVKENGTYICKATNRVNDTLHTLMSENVIVTLKYYDSFALRPRGMNLAMMLATVSVLLFLGRT